MDRTAIMHPLPERDPSRDAAPNGGRRAFHATDPFAVEPPGVLSLAGHRNVSATSRSTSLAAGSITRANVAAVPGLAFHLAPADRTADAAV